MNSTDSDIRRLIGQARDGNAEALGELLARHRPYLKLLAERLLDDRVAARLDASDAVQQTCLSVHRHIRQFLGKDEAQFIAWLREIHECTVRDLLRDHVYTQKRSVGSEQQVSGSQLAIDPSHSARTSSPSQRLMRREDSVRLAALLERLTADQREGVRLRFLEGYSLAEIAERMQRSEEAVAGLIKRGLKTLRKHLHDEASRQS